LFQIKIADFGISREMDSNNIVSIRGTEMYMSPEIFAGVHYDWKTDIW
jgi:serine/threonine protein kinase